MGWLTDQLSKGISDVSDYVKKNNIFSVAGDIGNQIGLNNTWSNDISDFFDTEVKGKADLRAAETETFLSGLPVVGGVINGINGVNQLEDLYYKTGKIPAYPGSNSPGAGGVANSIGQLARKIENGSNSLHEFYSGEPEVDPTLKTNNERMFRYMSENMNNRHGGPQ